MDPRLTRHPRSPPAVDLRPARGAGAGVPRSSRIERESELAQTEERSLTKPSDVVHHYHLRTTCGAKCGPGTTWGAGTKESTWRQKAANETWLVIFGGHETRSRTYPPNT